MTSCCSSSTKPLLSSSLRFVRCSLLRRNCYHYSSSSSISSRLPSAATRRCSAFGRWRFGEATSGFFPAVVAAPRRTFLIAAAKKYWNSEPGNDLLILGIFVFTSMFIMQVTLVLEVIDKIKQRNYLKYYKPDGTLRLQTGDISPPFSSEISREFQDYTPNSEADKIDECAKELEKQTQIAQSATVASSLLYDEVRDSAKEYDNAIYVDNESLDKLNSFMKEMAGEHDDDQQLPGDPQIQAKSAPLDDYTRYSKADDIKLRFDFPYLIIGAGLSAFTAAKTIMEYHPNASVLLLTNDSHPPYRKTLLSNQFLSNLTEFEGDDLEYESKQPNAIECDDIKYNEPKLPKRLKLCYESPEFFLNPELSETYSRAILSSDVEKMDDTDCNVKSVCYPGIYLLPNCSALNLDFKKSILICNMKFDGQPTKQPFGIHFGQLLVASGAKFVPENLTTQIDSSKILKLSDINDYNDMRSKLLQMEANSYLKPLSIAVFGQSPQCIEACVALRNQNRDSKITLIRPRKESIFSGTIWRIYINKLFENLEINALKNYVVDSLKPDPGNEIINIECISNNDGKTLSDQQRILLRANCILIHDVPSGNIEFLKNTPELLNCYDKTANLIKCDNNMNVIGNIWTCGDVCLMEKSNKDSDNNDLNKFNTIGLMRAENQAKIAGYNMFKQQLMSDKANYTKIVDKMNELGINHDDSVRYFENNQNDSLNYFWSDLTPSVGYETIGNCQLLEEPNNKADSQQISRNNCLTINIGDPKDNLVEESFLQPSITFFLDRPIVNCAKQSKELFEQFKCEGIMLFNADNLIQSLRPILGQTLTTEDMIEISKELNVISSVGNTNLNASM